MFMQTVTPKSMLNQVGTVIVQGLVKCASDAYGSTHKRIKITKPDSIKNIKICGIPDQRVIGKQYAASLKLITKLKLQELNSNTWYKLQQEEKECAKLKKQMNRETSRVNVERKKKQLEKMRTLPQSEKAKYIHSLMKNVTGQRQETKLKAENVTMNFESIRRYPSIYSTRKIYLLIANLSCSNF